MTKPPAAQNGKIPAMKERYIGKIAPALAKQFNHKNHMVIARMDKIVLNMGCGEAAHDAKLFEEAQQTLALISGQRPMITRSKQAISNFKIREGDPVGCKVTLRRDRMYHFLEKLIHVALPRIRDFRGLNPGGFDQGGNFAFGVEDQTIFPEVKADKINYHLGMDIVLVTTAETREEARALLEGMGFPFINTVRENG